MGKNFGGGNKHKKRKNNNDNTKSRSLRIKNNTPESDELYAEVIKREGGNPPRVRVMCQNGTEKNCVIRGSFIKRVWCTPGDVLIINYDKSKSDDKGYVIHKYNHDEYNELLKRGELNENSFKTNEEILTGLNITENVQFEVETDKKSNFWESNSNNNNTNLKDLDYFYSGESKSKHYLEDSEEIDFDNL